MARNVLITGGSGYLGGSLLQHLKDNGELPPHGTIYALVRSEEQARLTEKHYGVTPVDLDLSDQDIITETLLDKQISIVFFLIDAFTCETQIRFIKALGAVGQQLGVSTHFLHTTGAKIFSSLVGMPTDRPLSDADPDMYELQKSVRPDFPFMRVPVNTNNEIIEASDAHGVKSYIFIPCLVYGKGTGYGNLISIQTVAVVKAAKALRKMHKVDDLDGSWPVCHLLDTVTLYEAILAKILAGEELGSNRNGYYLASSGSVAWIDIYKAMAKPLLQCGVIDDADVHEPSDEAFEQMSKALGCEKEVVPVQMGGKCTLEADRGRTIGWSPRYEARHVLAAADEEVDLILKHLK